ncbi:MAG: putative HTH transcriptional regulator [Candidatus Marinamargulisbacteria bacterium]|jgi:predicted HTH transcriptional regulator
MEWNKLLDLVREGETTTCKFFGSIDKDDEIGPVIVAMANTKGGQIFIGLDTTNFHLNGTSLDRRWVQDLSKSHCSPSINIETAFITRNDRVILCLAVPEGTSKPYYYKKVCYVMDNNSNPHQALLRKESLRLGGVSILNSETETADSDENSASGFSHDFTQSYQRKASGEAELDIETPAAAESVEMDRDIEAITSELLDITRDVTEVFVQNFEDVNDRQKKAVEFLDDHESIKNSEYRELFGVSHKTAHLELVDLVGKGYLLGKGSGRSTRYEKNHDRGKQTTFHFDETTAEEDAAALLEVVESNTETTTVDPNSETLSSTSEVSE